MTLDEPRTGAEDRSRRAERWLPLVAVVAALLVNDDLLGNFFRHDDYLHLFSLANGPLLGALMEGHAGHWLFSYNLVFWLLHLCFGLNAALYFAALLLTHGSNVWLLYSIVRRSTGRPWLAAFGAALWGMCPYNQGTLGWISVLGHVYATTAVLWVVAELIELERSGRAPSRLQLARLYGLMLVAASSFGIGLGVAMGFGVAVWLWTPVPAARRRLALVFLSLILTIPIAYFGTSQFEAGGGGAGFIEGPRSYFEQAHMIPGGILYLAALGSSGLLLGPLVAGGTALEAGPTTVTIAYAVGALCTVAIALCLSTAPGRQRRLLLAWLVMAGCAYGIIALARWFTFSDAEPVYRYHYLSTALLTLALCQALSALVKPGSAIERAGRIAFVAWLAVAFVPYERSVRQDQSQGALQQRIQHHRVVGQIHEQLAMRPDAAGIYLENTGYLVQPWQTRSPLAFPGRAAFFILMYPSNVVDGTQVRFVERDPELLRLAREQQGSRLSELLVPPPEPGRGR